MTLTETFICFYIGIITFALHIQEVTNFFYKDIHLVNNNKKCSWGWNVVGRSIGLEGMVVLRRLVHLDEEH